MFRRIGRWMTLTAAVGIGALVALPVEALDPGRRAPEFELRALDGQPVKLAALRGKVVVVDFWASWCRPCRSAMPQLEQLYRSYRRKGLVVVGVSVDSSPANAKKFLSGVPVSFPIVHDAKQQVARQYRPPRMPSSFVIDRRGVVRHVQAGFRAGDDARIERMVKELL